jgi:15-cis-phytoene synthase
MKRPAVTRSAVVSAPWHDRALDAAGIGDPRLRQAYDRCRAVNADHGKTYYLAALLLPPDRRPHVYALYAFARVADEFVDDLAAPDPQGLLTWGEGALRDLAAGTSEDPVVAATAHTVGLLGLDLRLFEDFLAAMRQDITVTRYQSYDDLRRYMWGSACVIGLMMLPLLDPLTPDARDHAAALGEAFQMANFIRDVGEDLQRGRIYLPMDDLARFAVTEPELTAGQVTPGIRELLRFEIARTREIFRYAEKGIAKVAPSSRPCLATALELYGGILDEVERNDYQVFTHRARVPTRRRAAVALPALNQALRARREASRWHRLPTAG